MPLSDKNIVITPATGTGGQPTIKFTGGSATASVSTITFKVLDTGPISIEGNAGQLMSIIDTNTGTIFSVNDISGIPSIEVLDTGVVKLAGYGGQVAQGVSSPVPAGTTQADATPITTPIVYITTGSINAGLILPYATPGMRITVIQKSGNTIKVYPYFGATHNGIAQNTAQSVPDSINYTFVAVTTATWFTNSNVI